MKQFICPYLPFCICLFETLNSLLEKIFKILSKMTFLEMIIMLEFDSFRDKALLLQIMFDPYWSIMIQDLPQTLVIADSISGYHLPIFNANYNIISINSFLPYVFRPPTWSFALNNGASAGLFMTLSNQRSLLTLICVTILSL